MLPEDSSKFYQPYQIDAEIEFDWSRDIAAYASHAPYMAIIILKPLNPYAPFYLTEYKLDGTALPLSGDSRERRTVRLARAVRSTSLQSTQSRESAVLSASNNIER